jgi:hypothetical protein
MFLLHFLPDGFLQLIINIVLLTGAGLTGIGFFLVGFIPGLRNYKTLIQIVGVILLVVGIYWKGGYGVEMEWRAKVAELEAKVAAAEVKSKEVNTIIKEKIVTKTKVIHDTKVITKQVLKEVEKRIDSECTISPEVIDILNAAARNETPKGVQQ